MERPAADVEVEVEGAAAAGPDQTRTVASIKKNTAMTVRSLVTSDSQHRE
jgi:hypothetical protein